LISTPDGIEIGAFPTRDIFQKLIHIT
jgi:hypothetical protein